MRKAVHEEKVAVDGKGTPDEDDAMLGDLATDSEQVMEGTVAPLPPPPKVPPVCRSEYAKQL